jgi:hypothetical protein
MEELLKLVESQWGKVPTCGHCKMSKHIKYACSHCFDTFYCDENCQTSHLGSHFALIGGKGVKRERETSEKVEIDITYFTKDIWAKIAQFLNVEDVKNLSVVTQQMLYNMRHVMFMCDIDLLSMIWMLLETCNFFHSFKTFV